MESGSPGSVLERALAETQRVFSEVDKVPGRLHGLNPVWAVFDRVHLEVSLPLALRRRGGEPSGPETLPPRPSRAWAFLRGLAVHTPLFVLSLANLLRLRRESRPRVAIWTGDFYDPRNGGDFRLGGLYAHLNAENAAFVDLVRTHNGGLRQALANARSRGRPVIYYESLAFFLSGAWRARRPDFSAVPADHAAVLGRYAPEIAAVVPHARLFAALLGFLNVRSLVAWEFSSRQAALIFAAKTRGIPVIGFMHGAGMRSYMAHEFLPAAAGPLGPDVFGVWSSWWRAYFRRHTSLYGAVEVSGPMRRPEIAAGAPERATPARGPRVLWISEPLLDPDEAVPWLRHLCARFEVTIKKRPFTTDVFYKGLVARYPEFAALPTADGNIFQAIAAADVVIGSHSTAVIDASLAGVPFILVATQKWGDYFELESFDAPWAVYVRDVAGLDDSLAALAEGAETAETLRALRERFYGSGESDGSLWVARKALDGLR